MATAVKQVLLVLLLLAAIGSCKQEKPVEQKKPEPAIIIKPKNEVLSSEQRMTLGFPEDILSSVVLAAGADAEPFYVADMVKSENMKGEKGFERQRLAGFSVHTNKADDLISMFRERLRARGYLIFRSRKSYGKTNDVVSVVKGRNAYDILKIQGTEAPNYQLDTAAIIAWLKEMQKQTPLVVTGAGPDWVDVRFSRKPSNLNAVVKKVLLFAPDVLEHGPENRDNLLERMQRMNGFFLVWD